MTTASLSPSIEDLEALRTRLTGYCYRLLGAAADTDDAVQQTLVRAYRARDRFDPERAQLSTWVHRIATNVCLDELRSAGRRAIAIDLGPARTGADAADLGTPLPPGRFVEPMPDARLLAATDPAELAEQRESVRLAFVAALQTLAPRQRAVLVLRDVLSFDAEETAQILETTVAAVNSALQRARARLAASRPSAAELLRPDDPSQRELLDRYVAAFEAHDVDGLRQVLREDARSSMPPFAWSLAGRENILAVLAASDACRGDRLVPVAINGSPGFGQYRLDDDVLRPFALLMVEIVDGRIAGLTTFLGTAERFVEFGLPQILSPSDQFGPVASYQ